MTKHIEIKPMVIPVINHAYGIDSEFDITEKATTMFEEISYEIYRCSHGIVKYEQDSFVRVNKPIPIITLDDGKSFSTFVYDDLFYYLNWNRSTSVYDRHISGFAGEFWTYSDIRPMFNRVYRRWGYVQYKNVCLSKSVESFLELIVRVLQHGLRPNDWPYEGDPRKWLSRLPEKYWGNIK